MSKEYFKKKARSFFVERPGTAVSKEQGDYLRLAVVPDLIALLEEVAKAQRQACALLKGEPDNVVIRVGDARQAILNAEIES